MKAKMFFLVLAIFLVSLLPFGLVNAQEACDVAGFDDPLICGVEGENEEAALQGSIQGILETVYFWTGIIAVAVIIIGGVQYMTSSGEASKISTAKRTIIYAVIGLVLAIAAFAITEFVIGALEGKTTGGSESIHVNPGEEVEIKSIQISGLGTMKRGSEYTFRARIIPDYATDKTVTWTSSEPNVASISEKGVVKALTPGTTVITVTASNGKTATKTVTVPEPVEAQYVRIVDFTPSIKVGKSYALKAEVLPHNAENKELRWTSSDSSVLGVLQTGVINAKKAGKATITVATDNSITDTIEILVRENEDIIAKDKVGRMQQLVKSYAHAHYSSVNYNAKEAYKKDASSIKTGRGNIFSSWHGTNNNHGGTSCCAYVITVMRKSGLDTNFYKSDPKHILSQYFKGSGSSKWKNVTSKIKSNKDALPGDVIITPGGTWGHILLYSGNISGIDSNMTSASLGTRVPMSDGKKGEDISRYINNSRGYYVYRLKEFDK